MNSRLSIILYYMLTLVVGCGITTSDENSQNVGSGIQNITVGENFSKGSINNSTNTPTPIAAPTLPNGNPTPTIPASGTNFSCEININTTSPNRTIPFNQSFSGILRISHSGIEPTISSIPRILFDSKFPITTLPTTKNNWSFTFNPYNVDTRLDIGTTTLKNIQATVVDQNGTSKICTTNILMSPNSGTSLGTNSCRFLDINTKQPLLSQIKVTSTGTTFDWANVFILETNPNIKPTVRMRFQVEPFVFTANEASIRARDDGSGWGVHVLGRPTVHTIIEVDMGSNSNACTITADPTLN